MKKSALRRIAITLTFLCIITFPVFAQDNFVVNGKVTDEGNHPLEGVTIQVKGTTTFTMSKKNGAFTITAPSSNSLLVISSVGFREQEVPISGKSEVNVTMLGSATSLNDVVVVGYGTQKKSDVTGAVQK